MRAAHVSVVIATYRRVDALRCTLRSLLLQAHADWTALVMGDACGAETGEMVRALREPRIRYYNLRRRFGEQSGPNTAGLHLATGDFVAFLNHDDLLLGDHLTRAVAGLGAGAADLYVGQFADATRLEDGPEGVTVPVFTRLRPESGDLSLLASADPWCFDPSSFWLIRTAYARAVGPWRPARSLRRTPLRDWIMRAWRLGGTFRFGDTVTGLRFWTQNLRSGAPLYAHATPEHEYMIERMGRESPDATRAFIRRQLEGAARDAGAAGRAAGAVRRRDAWVRPWRWRATRAWRLLLAGAYLKLGVDVVSVAGRVSRRPAGALLDHLARRRTGEGLPAAPTLEDFLRDPEAHRVC